ncbi:MAG: hypothetical protein ACPG5T_04125, partial [Endozoicomonas sp.]
MPTSENDHSKDKACRVNTVSFISALEYLKKHYRLDHRIGFISNKLRQASESGAQLTLEQSIEYLEELDFLVEQASVERLEVVQLETDHLLFCFDHEHDIIILRHNSDFDRTR